ncbi:MAG: hypothetical protein GY817_06095 [bacterium]|nr:hypothetical protein [bacterium]
MFKRIIGYLHLNRLFKKYKSCTDLGILLKNKVVVFNTISYDDGGLVVDGFLAAILRIAGIKSFIILDDGNYAHWDSVQYNQYIRKDNTIALNMYHSNKRWKMSILKWLWDYVYRVPIICTSEFIETVKVEEEDYALIDIEKHIISSSRRYFSTCTLDFDNNEIHKDYYYQCKKNVEVAIKTAKYCLDVLKVDISIVLDGVYSMRGVFHEYLKAKKVNSYVRDNSSRGDNFDIILMNSSFLDSKNLTRWFDFSQKYEVSDDQRKQMIDYFEARLNMKKENRMYFPEQKKMSLSAFAKPIFLLFPNVLWDGNIVERDRIFKHILEWLEETIKFFKNNPESGHLIVRFHPSESTLLSTSLSLEHILREEFPKEYFNLENITFISSSSYVDSYDLIRQADVCLIYDNTTAQEAVYLEKPVVLVSNGRNSRKGFTFEPENKEEYFEILKNPKKIISDFKLQYFKFLENMFKFTYFILYDAKITIPTIKYTYNVKYRNKNNMINIKYSDIQNCEKEFYETLKDLESGY